MFFDVHINHVLLAKLVDDANYRLAPVSGNVRKRALLRHICRKMYFIPLKHSILPQAVAVYLIDELSWSHAF